MRPLIRTLAALAVASVSSLVPGAHAAPCAGFTDVADNDPFCPDIGWAKNRGISQGCATGLYCPNDATTRAQMAAFLHRFGATSAAMHWVDVGDTFVGRAGPGFSIELTVANARVLLPMEAAEPRGYKLRYADAKFDFEAQGCAGRRYFKPLGGNFGAANLAVVSPAPMNVNFAYIAGPLDPQPFVASEGDLSSGTLVCTDLAAPGFRTARYQAVGPYPLPPIAFPLLLR